MNPGGIIHAMKQVNAALERQKPFSDQGARIVYDPRTTAEKHECKYPQNADVTYKDIGMIVEMACGHYCYLASGGYGGLMWKSVRWWNVKLRRKIRRAQKET